jgi:hypothetical protein
MCHYPFNSSQAAKIYFARESREFSRISSGWFQPMVHSRQFAPFAGNSALVGAAALGNFRARPASSVATDSGASFVIATSASERLKENIKIRNQTLFQPPPLQKLIR